jgi:hypothetical protein
METATTAAMKCKEIQIGTSPTRSEMMNFTPTKTRIIGSPMLKYRKRFMRPASMK